MHERARKLRRNGTEAECILWARLRRRQLGVKFRRQAVIGPFIADFACFAERLVIELDGPIHEDPVREREDRERQRWLENAGFQVLRFRNSELYRTPDAVVTRIKQILACSQ
jgi:very-short-patch-repair endonuclease